MRFAKSSFRGGLKLIEIKTGCDEALAPASSVALASSRGKARPFVNVKVVLNGAFVMVATKVESRKNSTFLIDPSWSCASAVRVTREGDSGTKTSPPIHLRVRAPKGITEPVDVLDLGILGSYKPLPGRQERRAIVR